MSVEKALPRSTPYRSTPGCTRASGRTPALCVTRLWPPSTRCWSTWACTQVANLAPQGHLSPDPHSAGRVFLGTKCHFWICHFLHGVVARQVCASVGTQFRVLHSTELSPDTNELPLGVQCAEGLGLTTRVCSCFNWVLLRETWILQFYPASHQSCRLTWLLLLTEGFQGCP